MAVEGHEPRADAVTVEEDARPPRVLAEDEIRLGELAERAQGDVLEVADRRRADDERHVRQPSSSASNATSADADQPRLGAELGVDDPHLVARGREGPLGDDLPRGVEQELARLGEAAADDDELGVEDVDEVGDPDAEVEADVLEHVARVARPCGGELDQQARVDLAARRGRAAEVAVRVLASGTLRQPVGGQAGRERFEVPAARTGALARRAR